MEFLKGLSMRRRMLSPFAIARNGLRCRVVNNGTTGTVSWGGYDLETADPTGIWSVETSNDGTSWTQAVTEAAAATTTATQPNLGNPGVAKYFRVRAFDSGETTVYATSNVVTVIRANTPVTGLSIVSATDDGSGTTFSLEYDFTAPSTYTSTYIRLVVNVESLEVYNAEILISDDTAVPVIDDLPGVPGDDVDIEVTVLGRTGVLGAASTEETAIGTVEVDGDPDAATYLGLITSSGTTPNSTQITAEEDWHVAGKANGWYSSVKAWGGFYWQAAAANAVRAIVGGSGTFVATSTHSQYRVVFSSNGYFKTGVSGASSSLNLLFSSCGLANYRYGGTNGGTSHDIGNGANATGEDFFCCTNAGIGCVSRSYSNASGNLGAGGRTTPGLYQSNFYSTTQGEYVLHASGSDTSLATSSSLTIPAATTMTVTRDVMVGGNNESTGYGRFSNNEYSFWAVNSGMTTTQSAYFRADTYAKMVALGVA